jgi:predicted DNA-binding transcriptional regulator AlpA
MQIHLLTSAESRERLKISSVSFWRLRQRPDFPKPFQFIDKPLWSSEELGEWIERQRAAKTQSEGSEK